MEGKTLKCPKCGEVFTIDESQYAEILGQVKSQAFNEEVARREEQVRKQFDAEMRLKQKDNDILVNGLKQKISSFEDNKQAAIKAALAEKELELVNLRKAANDAVIKEREKQAKNVSDRDLQIQQLKSAAEVTAKTVELEKADIRRDYDAQLKDAQAEIDRLKNYKLRQSTKMVGESLEKHCAALYAQLLRPVLTDATFEKDNDSTPGSKGDFIFREQKDGIEFASIMFEMKDQSDETKTKHKNEDFLAKLDQDRRNKGCEFAVLVSLLELDNEMYEAGIVDMSHKYPKMYVIRPQYLIPMITLIRQTSLKALDYKKQLAIARQQSIDVTHFEQDLNDFKDKFGKNYRLASEKFKAAVDEIDKTIDHLKKVKEALIGSENNLRLANKKAEELTIKSLTKNNPTMREMFEEVPVVTEEEPETAPLPEAPSFAPTADDFPF